ncbi:Os10g0116400 [Oryza sativa Japonica Group]|nr:Os10g0116400 [Oryza sativa Japonica Group]|eukprot:NP_001064052.2 Os10g0116400 [Oryza sativa Japonica Group]
MEVMGVGVEMEGWLEELVMANEVEAKVRLAMESEQGKKLRDHVEARREATAMTWKDAARCPDELRTYRGLLERCGKLLSSIQAFTAGDDQQPCQMSVLDAAAFLADEDSLSSSRSKRTIFTPALTSSGLTAACSSAEASC